MTQKDIDHAMLKQAILWGLNSSAKRFKVGAMIVKNSQIVSDGFNGTPRGFDNTCEELDPETGELRTKSTVLHAESNAITKLARFGGIGSDQATIYSTVAPCLSCAKLIMQSGITRVVFAIEYRNSDGLTLLAKAGVELIHIHELANFYSTQLALLEQEQEQE